MNVENQDNNKIHHQNNDKIEEFEEPLAQPGKIFLAEIHGSAQRFLKIKKLSKYIRFCKCCLLPTETPGVVIPFTCLDKKEDFGIGIQLYFFYIYFCIVVCFTALFLSSIPSMVFSKRYYNDLRNFCDTYFTFGDSFLFLEEVNNTGLNTTSEYCVKYLTIYINIRNYESDSSLINNDWISKFSSINILNYYNIFKENTKDPEIITDSFFNYSFVYFLTSITLLIINFFYIHYVNLLDDKDNFGSTTPRDFTLLIHRVKRPHKNISKIQHLNNIITEISQDYFKLELQQIIPCYNLTELFKLTKDVFEDKIKIYHAYNFKRQKNLHKLYMKQHKIDNENFNINNYYHNEIIKINDEKNNINSIINQNSVANINNSQLSDIIQQKNITNEENINRIFIHNSNLNYYSKFLWIIKATPLNIIEQRIAKKNKRIKEIEKDLAKNPDKYSSGTYFVVFKYMRMKDQFYDFYPTNLVQKILIRIKYFFQNIIFSKCVSEKTKRRNYLKTEIKVQYATEAYEVYWQNLGYSFCQKILFFSFSFVVTIILIFISFGIIYLLNYCQFKLAESEGAQSVYGYLLSFVISIIIAEINSLARKLLKLITRNFEAIETKTEYYVSLSVKLTIFTFLNTNIVPLVSNVIQRKYNDYGILLNNLFMIFLTNFTLNPIVFYLNPNLLLKLSKRAKARMKLEGKPIEESVYTQDELNRLFQNPSMSLCYKYSFYSNVVLTTFFYMSLFPLGVVFSIVGLLLSYFLEIVHLGFYKRPEILNSRLCKCFVYNFKVAMAVFAIGNYIFLHDVDKHSDINWSLINLILFIVIVFIPYDSIKFNLLGVKEGDITKGSYDEYELMFPTDYEKQNPLTKKEAMIKYFERLRSKNLIDKIQSDYLINKIQKESSMANYYKTTKNVGNVLNYYEFQNQLAKLKKKQKFIKEIKNKNRKINNYDIYIKQKAKERRQTLKLKKDLDINEKEISKPNYDVDNFINIMNKQNSLYEDSNAYFKKNYNVKELVKDNQKSNSKKNNYLKEVVIQNMKAQGIYSETEDEIDDDSIKNDENSDETSPYNNN